MGWIIAICILSFIAISLKSIFETILDSGLGKIVIGAAVVAVGLLVLNAIIKSSVLVTLARVCAVVMVVMIVVAILKAIIGF